MVKTGVHMDVKFVNAERTIGTVDGILQTSGSRLFQDDVARMFYSYMSKEFDIYASLAARSNPEKYGHMYDWNMLGFKSGKLWQDRLVGGVGRRQITFDFIPSTKPVPETTPQNTGISSANFPNLRRNGTYMFPNKAAVFELGITTNILPQEHDRVFVPLKHKGRGGWRESQFGGKLTERDKKRGFVWAKSTQQDHHETQGRFTSLFLMFFESQADRVYKEKVEPRVNNRIRRVYRAGMPNLGGNAKVSKTGKNISRKFKVGAVVDANKHASRELNKEMRQAVKAASEGDYGND